MKICDITMFYSATGGGVRRYLEIKRRWLRKTLPSVRHVMVIPGEEQGSADDGLGRVYSVGGVPLPFSPGYRLPVGSRRIARIIRDEAPDIIEAGSPFTMRRAVSAYLRRKNGPPVFDYYHAYFPPSYAAALGRPLTFLKAPLLKYGWHYLRAAYADSRRILVASPVIRDVLRARGLENTALAPLGVDLRRFVLSPATGGRRTLLFVGRLTEEKGLSVALETYHLLSQRMKLRFLIAGDGLLRTTVEELAEQDSNVSYLGYVPNSRMPRVYGQADLLVSAAPTETLGLYFLEALACGVPVAGLSGSGLMDVLPDDVARAVPHQLPRELARVCGELLEDPPARERCREVALDYSWPRRLQRIVGLEAELAGMGLSGAGL